MTRAMILLVAAMGSEDGYLTLSELSVHLSSQNVEQVGRFRHARNLHIAILVLTVEFIGGWEDARILITQLKISFHAARRMLGSLSIISVGQ